MSYQKQLIRKAQNRIRQEKEAVVIDEALSSESNLSEVRGIWNATIAKLREVWIRSKEQLKEAWEEVLSKIDLNPLSAKSVLNFIKE